MDLVTIAGFVAILGTLFGILIPMIRNMERRIDSRIDKLESRVDRLDGKVDSGFATLTAQIVDIHRHLNGINRYLGVEPELVLAGSNHRKRAA